MKKKKRENGARGKRESAKRQREMKSSFIHTVSSKFNTLGSCYCLQKQ